MEERAIKCAAVAAVLVAAVTALLLPELPKIHTWAVEREEDALAKEEQQAGQQTAMNELEIAQETKEDETPSRQLRLRLPEGVSGDEVTVTDDYLTQTVRIEIPDTDEAYFESHPVSGSSDHVDSMSYATGGTSGVIEIVTDQVYELDTEYDGEAYYFDFLTPHEVYDKVVVIDAGHGGRASGASKSGIEEKNIDLAIVLALKELFDESEENIGVYYTRLDDSNPTFAQRVQLANKSQADLFISIHNNSLKGSRYRYVNGTQVMYSESDTAELGSRKLAEICLSHVTEALGSADKGLVEGDEIYIIRSSEVPVALIEVGFMTNKEELARLNDSDYQKAAAQGIYDAVLEAFEKGF